MAEFGTTNFYRDELLRYFHNGSRGWPEPYRSKLLAIWRECAKPPGGMCAAYRLALMEIERSGKDAKI